jgi:hypothetical protein
VFFDQHKDVLSKNPANSADPARSAGRNRRGVLSFGYLFFSESSWISVGVDQVSTGSATSKKRVIGRWWRNRASFADTSEVGLAGGTSKRKASVRCAAGSLSFYGQKESDQSEGLPRQSKPKVCSATGIFRLANPWLGRKTTRIPARRPPGLQSASARILG